MQPKFDKMGRRILISSPKSGSAANSTPGTPQPSNVRCATFCLRVKEEEEGEEEEEADASMIFCWPQN
jgi:hypothetical protein